MSDESVTQWLENLKDGDRDAAQPIWQRYVERLTRLARRKLTVRGVNDEEDLALSVFDRFCRAAEEGKFARLSDRDDLWQVLIVLTERKAHDYRRRELADKRGGGKVHDEGVLDRPGPDDSARPGIQQVADGNPSPQFAVLLAEELEIVLAGLQDETLQKVAVDKLQGYTNAEIAKRLSVSLSSVERKLRLIRRTWEERPH